MQGTDDPAKKPPAKKALPPPANPPPQGSTSAAAAFRAKSALPPPNGPPPNGPTASASVAKIRGAARPPSGAPPPNGAAPSKPALAPPSGAPPPKGEAKPASTSSAEPPGSKDEKSSEAKPEAKRVGAPPTARPPSASAGAKPTPKPTPSQAPPPKSAAAVDILGDSSPEFVSPAAKQTPAVTPTAAPTPKPALQPKPEAQPIARPTTSSKPLMTGSQLLDPALLKPQGPKKSTMEVLNDTTASLTTRRSTLGDDYEVPATVAADVGSTHADDQASNGVYASKMGKAAQFSGLSRPNAPEEEVLVVKKVEPKPVQEEKHTTDAKQSEQTPTQTGAKSTHHAPRLDESFDDVEEIPFLDELKPEPKGKEPHKDAKTTPSAVTAESEDPEVVIESKHGPPKVRGTPSSSHAEAKKEQKEDDSGREKSVNGVGEDDQVDRNDDIYHELRKLKRKSPREDDDDRRDSFSTQSGATGGIHMDESSSNGTHTNNEKKESRDSETDSKESATEESHGTSSSGREKSREKRKERRRHKHEDEPKKIQAQVRDTQVTQLNLIFANFALICIEPAVLQPQECAVRT